MLQIKLRGPKILKKAFAFVTSSSALLASVRNEDQLRGAASDEANVRSMVTSLFESS